MKTIRSFSVACHSLLVCVLLTQCNSYTTYSPPPNHTALTKDTASMLGLHYFLPRSKITISGDYVESKNALGDKETNFVVNVVEKRYADNTAPQFAQITENILYAEDSTLEVKDGLLNSAIARPEDKTPEILQTVAQTILNGMQIPPHLFNKMTGLTSTAPEKVFKAFSVTFDPFIKIERDNAQEVLLANGWVLKFSDTKDVRVGDGPKPQTKRPLFGKSSAPSLKDVAVAGLAYRRPYPLIQNLAVVKGWSVDTKAKKAVYPARLDMTLPDPSTLAYVPIKRGFMTKRETEVTFTNGDPTKIVFKAPSPVLGVVQVPAKISKMALDAVPAIIKVQSAP